MSQTVKLLDEDREEQRFSPAAGFRVPKADGSGMATAFFVDGTMPISNNGSYNVRDKEYVNVNVSGSITPDGVAEHAINFYDVSGRRVFSYTRAQVQVLSELPAGPTVQGASFIGWYSDTTSASSTAATLADVQSCKHWSDLAAVYDCDILTFEFHTQTIQSITLYCATGGHFSVNWGDGSSAEDFTATTDGAMLVSHSYSAGEYNCSIRQLSATASVSLGTVNPSATSGGASCVSPNNTLKACVLGSLQTSRFCLSNCGFLQYLFSKRRQISDVVNGAYNLRRAIGFLSFFPSGRSPSHRIDRLSFRHLPSSAGYPTALKSIVFYGGTSSTVLELTPYSEEVIIYPRSGTPHLSTTSTQYGYWANTKFYVNDTSLFKSSSYWASYINQIFSLDEYPDY